MMYAIHLIAGSLRLLRSPEVIDQPYKQSPSGTLLPCPTTIFNQIRVFNAVACLLKSQQDEIGLCHLAPGWPSRAGSLYRQHLVQIVRTVEAHADKRC